MVWARQVAAHVLRGTTALTLKEIGLLLGRDHTTVIHALRRVEARRVEEGVGWSLRAIEAEVRRSATGDPLRER